MVSRRARQAGWDLPCTVEERERARLILLERLRNGELKYAEYEAQTLLVDRSRYVGELYRATFSRSRLLFVGPRWAKRMKLIDGIAFILSMILLLTGQVVRLSLAVVAAIGALLVLLNIAAGVQWLRFRRSHQLRHQARNVV